MPDCLNCIGMKQDTASLQIFPDFSYWLNCPNFIVGEHYRNEFSIGTDSFFYAVQRDASLTINRQVSHIYAFTLKRMACI
ncbi:MAG: hypothetical protein A2075_23895 [Geobacteraceae bacterium GWC2_58_44]|nr:MAG: hypothetical protein A2075_23895 [Geobacteraceae bacterium GWC2_58_44]